ncbi:MAG: DUF3124 domain-containing protein [Bacteroidota bacterium]
MPSLRSVVGLLLSLIFLAACQPSNQNINEEGKDKLEIHEVVNEPVQTDFRDTIYVPIYSSIYSQTKDESFLLTATLSIRNTSMSDSMYIQAIDYYNTKGDLVRKYTENTLFLKPLESIDYVIDEADESGGTGANFIIIWSAKDDRLKPVFEAIMISTRGQQGISFTASGISISRNR